MIKVKYFVGIDISKATLDVCLFDGKRVVARLVVKNIPSAIRAIVKQLRKHLPDCTVGNTLFCAEHTGVYNNLIYRVAATMDWNLVVEPATQIKKSMGIQRGKNDQVDAERIARYAAKNSEELRLWEPMKTSLKEIKALQTQRNNLIRSKLILTQCCTEDQRFQTKAITKIKAALISAPVRALGKSIKAIDQKIDQIIKSDPELKRLDEIVTSVVGVGRQNSITFLVRTNAFKDFLEPRKYACYGGVVPFEHRSGSSIKGRPRVSRQANGQVKQLLQMAAINACRWDPGIKKYYERKVQEGKNKMSVLNAIRNKIIHRVFACVRENRKYIVETT